jgi:hypothetical protein
MGFASEEFGPKFWLLMHSMAQYFDKVDIRYAREFFRYIRNVLPCKECRQHFEKFTIPDKNYASWLKKVHNEVNERLNKPLYEKKVKTLVIDSEDFNKILIKCAYYANYEKQTRLTRAFIPFILSIINSSRKYNPKYLKDNALISIYEYSKTRKSFEEVMEKLEIKSKKADCKNKIQSCSAI